MRYFEGNSLIFTAITRLLAIILFFSFFFISFLQSRVDNHDFWWHLATGKYITENRALPQDDPFSYATHAAPSDRKSIILKGYWLSQIISYKAYTLSGFKAIAVLRSLLMLGFLFFVFLNVKRQTSSYAISLIFAIIIFLIAVPYSADRPQLFTFVIFSIVYYLLEDIKVGASRRIYFIPMLVMVLANMHPGFIVCVLLISIYLLASGIRLIVMKDPTERQGFRKLLIIWTLSILLSMLNPTGLTGFREIFRVSEYRQEIIEFMPTLYLFAKKLSPLNYPYISFLILSLFSFSQFRKIGLNRILLLAVFSFMSFASIRYVIFYMCVAAPIIARTVIILGEKKVFAAPVKAANTMKGLFYFTFCVIGVFLSSYSLSGLAEREFKSAFLTAVPKDSADFLENLPVKGNMLNDYGFGGYLIWRLYPGKKVFIDGRTLEYDVYNEYKIATLTLKNRPQSWEDIIRKHDISYVVVPPLLYQGQIYPLVEKLYDSMQWSLIYKDDKSLVFLHNDSRNMSLAEKYAIDKTEVLNAIIIQANKNARDDLTNPYYLISLGKAYMKSGKYDEAEKAFLKAYERDPGNAETSSWIQKLRGSR